RWRRARTAGRSTTFRPYQPTWLWISNYERENNGTANEPKNIFGRSRRRWNPGARCLSSRTNRPGRGRQVQELRRFLAHHGEVDGPARRARAAGQEQNRRNQNQHYRRTQYAAGLPSPEPDLLDESAAGGRY